MFNTLIVAIDIQGGQRRSVGVATRLAGRGQLPVEVVSVVSPRSEPSDAEWRRPLTRHDDTDDLTILRGDDVATAIVDYVRNRDGALLVMTTAAAGLLSLRRRGVTGQVLAGLRQPVLLLGPKLADPLSLTTPTLIAGVDRTHDSPPALPVIESWQRTFGGGRPWVVEVIATAAWPAGSIDDAVEREDVGVAVDALATHGIDAAARVLHGGDPVWALLDFAEQVEDPVFVMTSDRWAGGRSHWYSTTRRLVQRSPRPVLVVPGDGPGY